MERGRSSKEQRVNKMYREAKKGHNDWSIISNCTPNLVILVAKFWMHR